MQPITRDEVKASLDKGAPIAIIEALPEKYYAEGHLPGALLMPPDQIENLAPLLLKDKDQIIVTYCANATCSNSHAAAKKLEALGYKNVRVYAEGKEDWKKAGLKMEGGACCGGMTSCATSEPAPKAESDCGTASNSCSMDSKKAAGSCC